MSFQDGSLAGSGVGLRQAHVEAVIATQPPIPWFEVLADNYLGIGGQRRVELQAIRDQYPVALHCVGLDLGGTDPLDLGYLDALARLRDELRPAWISDHLCWSRIGGRRHYDLLPLPFDRSTLARVRDRVKAVQDRLGEQILVENVSAYVRFATSPAPAETVPTPLMPDPSVMPSSVMPSSVMPRSVMPRSVMPEWEFVATLAEEADCALLLDVNNVYVNAHNFGFDPLRYLESLPAQRVRQMHLAGFSRRGELLVDTHSTPIAPAVWQLFRASLKTVGAVPVCVERDADIPALEELLAEAQIAAEALAELEVQEA